MYTHTSKESYCKSNHRPSPSLSTLQECLHLQLPHFPQRPVLQPYAFSTINCLHKVPAGPGRLLPLSKTSNPSKKIPILNDVNQQRACLPAIQALWCHHRLLPNEFIRRPFVSLHAQKKRKIVHLSENCSPLPPFLDSNCHQRTHFHVPWSRLSHPPQTDTAPPWMVEGFQHLTPARCWPVRCSKKKEKKTHLKIIHLATYIWGMHAPRIMHLATPVSPLGVHMLSHFFPALSKSRIMKQPPIIFHLHHCSYCS